MALAAGMTPDVTNAISWRNDWNRAITLSLYRSATDVGKEWVWLGLRNSGPLDGMGLYRMLQRRADQAGYDPKLVHPHMFRHILSA